MMKNKLFWLIQDIKYWIDERICPKLVLVMVAVSLDFQHCIIGYAKTFLTHGEIMNTIFKAWPKIARIENKKECYTEKIDGTNACVVILPLSRALESQCDPIGSFLEMGGTFMGVWAQSRNQLICPGQDNAGFALWVSQNINELSKLGQGYHYGEWWGKGIQRGYDLKEKRFSLFNVKRWGEHNPNTPSCCSVVPIINRETLEEAVIALKKFGSFAAPGYMNVEGIVVYEYNTDSYFKHIINKPK